MNRNSVAKYLEVLQMAGDSEMKKVCTAKLYFPSHRIPITEMLSLSRDLIVVLDNDNTIIEINETFLTLVGATRDEIVGRDAEDTPLFIFNNPEIMEILLSEEEKYNFSREIYHNHEGNKYIFRLKLIPTNLSNGKHGTVIIVEDVTEKSRFEKKLEEREAFYRSVIEDQTEYIVRYDPDMIITFANEPFCKLVGKTPDELVGTKKYLPVPNAYRRRVQRHFEILLPEHSVGVLENPLINADGKTIWCEWTNRAFYDGKQIVGYQSVGRDITDRINL
jgi:PAS domain S-box-containing protein